jgi:hypothetical protein
VIPCHCVTLDPEAPKRIHGTRGCKRCGGRGVVATVVTAAQRAALVAAGWLEEGGRWRHAERYGTARAETALALMDDDSKKAAKRAAERETT